MEKTKEFSKVPASLKKDKPLKPFPTWAKPLERQIREHMGKVYKNEIATYLTLADIGESLEEHGEALKKHKDYNMRVIMSALKAENSDPYHSTTSNTRSVMHNLGKFSDLIHSHGVAESIFENGAKQNPHHSDLTTESFYIADKMAKPWVFDKFGEIFESASKKNIRAANLLIRYAISDPKAIEEHEDAIRRMTQESEDVEKSVMALGNAIDLFHNKSIPKEVMRAILEGNMSELLHWVDIRKTRASGRYD